MAATAQGQPLEITTGAAAACPCGSGLGLDQCCGPYLRGADLPPTALALMRSRYSAYVLRDEAYLVATWHPATRPAQLNLSDDETLWEGLQILRQHQGGREDDRGEVEFVARYRQSGDVREMRERSRFERVSGRWYYRDGRVTGGVASAAKPGRNDACSCGSGRKFKKCCGA